MSARARQVIDFVIARSVAKEAATYSDTEWREMAAQAGEYPVSTEDIHEMRSELAERTPFGGSRSLSSMYPIERAKAMEGFYD